MARLVTGNFIPVRVHVREQAAEFERLGARYGALWTPTILVLDAQGEERHRIEGFLPAEDFLAQLQLGLAKSDFARQDYRSAEDRFRELVDRHPDAESAPEALYWAGVSRYKGTGDAAALSDTARSFRDRYRDSAWAKKASVWAS